MPLEAIKMLLFGSAITKLSVALEAGTSVNTSADACFNGKAINNMESQTISPKFINKFLMYKLFHSPEISGLTYKLGAVGHSGKKVRPMLLEVLPDSSIFIQPTPLTYQFHCR